jgi:hypothetical protein
MEAKKEKKKGSLFLKQEQHMKENGEVDLEMDMEFKFGLMVPNTKDFGKIIKLVEMESLLMQMEISIKVNGLTIKRTELGRIIISMEQNI